MTLPLVAGVAVYTDERSAAVLQRFPGLHLDPTQVAAVLRAPDPVAAGIAAAVAEARALLAVDGVVGVNLSGLASAAVWCSRPGSRPRWGPAGCGSGGGQLRVNAREQTARVGEELRRWRPSSTSWPGWTRGRRAPSSAPTTRSRPVPRHRQPAALAWLGEALRAGRRAAAGRRGRRRRRPGCLRRPAASVCAPVLVEPMLGACRAARRLFGFPDRRPAAGDRLPLATGSVDAAWCLGVLCTTEPKGALLARAAPGARARPAARAAGVRRRRGSRSRPRRRATSSPRRRR